MSRLETYFDPRLAEVEEIQEIIRALSAEFEMLNNRAYSVLCNMFIMHLDENGCARYEKMLGIKAAGTDTIDDRRFRILALFKGDTPYTLISLRRKLNDLCGEENVDITLDAANYKITILIGIAQRKQYNTALSIIKQMLPCNLVLDYGLRYNQHSTLSNYTHAQLSAYTHSQVRNDVINL